MSAIISEQRARHNEGRNDTCPELIPSLRQVICQMTIPKKTGRVTRRKDVVLASGFSELDDNVASVLPRTQIFKSCKGVLESEDLLVNDWLEIDLVLCEEVAQILLISCRSDADAPGMRSVVLQKQ